MTAPSQKVYALKAEDVRDGRILTLDEAQILRKAAEYGAKVGASLK